jgi:hypothetical protein
MEALDIFMDPVVIQSGSCSTGYYLPRMVHAFVTDFVYELRTPVQFRITHFS